MYMIQKKKKNKNNGAVPLLYLKYNIYLQQQDIKSPSNTYFLDIPLGALRTLIYYIKQDFQKSTVMRSKMPRHANCAE